VAPATATGDPGVVYGETGSFVVVCDLAGVEVLRRSGTYKGVLR
jgi:hypothetical protein